MWLIYRKSDKEIMGSTVAGDVKIAKEEALKQVVDGLVGQPDISEFDAIELSDGAAQEAFRRPLIGGQTRLVDRGDGTLTVGDSSAETAEILVTTNAQDFHPVDGVPLLPGDGESFLVVTLEKVRESDDASRISAGGEEKEQEDVIWLRPSHGSIREDTDERSVEIRSIRLEGGTARFRFYSDPAKRLASVQMLSANPNLQLDSLQVEFI
ncbi:MAG TPA: hypothetical protein VF179_27170 [Thermoanaerobaculia bacterium]|nr:hypothetical protein [Thermoanaerobaculia bacterium]